MPWAPFYYGSSLYPQYYRDSSQTLSRVEEDSEFRQDDSAVVQLKRHILQSLAEFESQKSRQPHSEPQPGTEFESPISVLRLR